MAYQSEGFFSRLKGSLGGIITGILLVLGGIGFLFWNEGRAVSQYKALQEGEASVVSISSTALKQQWQDKLVHFSGQATSDEVLSDDLFGVRSDGLKLSRQVEMFQWVEVEDTTYVNEAGGKRTKRTSYDYRTEWSSTLIDSNDFARGGHQNPSTMPFRSETQAVARVNVGMIQLDPGLVSDIDRTEVLNAADIRPPPGPAPAQAYGQYVVYGFKPDNPQVGDLRVRFVETPEQPVSVVAKLQGRSAGPYEASNGNTLMLLQTGTHSAEKMFGKAHDDNTALTWMLRVAGFLGLFAAFAMILKPIRVLADVIPLLGRLAGAAINLVAGLLAVAVAAVTIAVAWLFFRPLLAVGLLLVSAACLFVLQKLGLFSKKSTAAPVSGDAPPPPPPPGPTTH